MPRNRHKGGAPEGTATLEQLLGTNLRSEQEARVASLLAAVHQMDLFVLLTINPYNGQTGVAHSRGLNEMQLSALLNWGHEYLAQEKMKAAQQQPPADASVRTENPLAGIPGQPFPDPGELVDPGPVGADSIVTPIIGSNGQPELPPSPAENLPPSYEATEGQNQAQGAGD